MIKTYTYKVKTNKKLELELEEWLGVTRYVYNLAREVREESFKRGVLLNYYNLSKQLTEAKKEYIWLKKVHSQTLQAVLERLENGYKKFFRDLKSGVTCSKPHWAKKDKWVTINFKSIKVVDDSFRLPSIGKIKVFNFKQPKGDLRTANLVREVDGWYLKVVVKKDSAISENQTVVAIDMGLKFFLTTSDGEFVDNPKHLFKYQNQLRVENRKLSRMKKGGSNFKKQKKVLSKLYQKISRVRKDFLHKESRKLANAYGVIIREDLNISKMIKNSKLAKHILDCSWGTFFLYLDYKTKVFKVNPAYTSQKCSECGHTCKENRKTQSLFECVKCSYTENADLQATFNILQLGHQLMEANVEQ